MNLPACDRWRRNARLCFPSPLVSHIALVVATVAALPGSARAQAGIELSYLGNAGWQITDGKTVVLVDPYLTRAKMATPNDPVREADTRPLVSRDAIAQSDTATIDTHIRRADFIVVTHTHADHVLDVPYIARKTGALVIGTESTINYARASGVPASQLLAVKGGDDLEFGVFSLRVIPSVHGILRRTPNRQLTAGPPPADEFPADAKPPFRYRDFVEGGTLAYLIRLGGVQVIVFGSMNYIEREVAGLRPDVALVGAMTERREIYHYTARLMRALGDPPLVLPTHWDAFNVPYGMSQQPAIDRVQSFVAEVKAASPNSRVIVPGYFRPIRVPARRSRPGGNK
ncbi:MAG TPA: MBL fold metallo-hydrolase [Candidatus Acidoferrales bacterium]|nr:MBL fold metallo-hydrolase [Candidatus Acidoferrales bacterium]